MRNDIKQPFNGTLNFDGIKCAFIFKNGYSLEISPLGENEEDFKAKCKLHAGDFDALGWIYGSDTRGNNFAFKPSERQALACWDGIINLIIDIVFTINNTTKFEPNDVTDFFAIDFCGSAVDSVFPPKLAISHDLGADNVIMWKNCEESAKIFNTSIMGEKCKLIFTISVDRDDLNMYTTELGAVTSIMRLEFEKTQSISSIDSYWEACCNFLAFLTSHFNISDLNIYLWDRTVGSLGFTGTIECYINNDKVENIRYDFPKYYQFNIESLGEKTGDLFKLFNRKEEMPYLGFLPKTNTDININRNKLRDLCTSLEVEYSYQNESFPDEEVKYLVKVLKNTVKDYRKNNSGLIDAKTYDYIFSSLKFISLPASKKIYLLYLKYAPIINKHYDNHSFNAKYKFILTDEQTENDIGWLVKIRNNATHSTGLTKEVIPNAIYSRLKILVYCSVLNRAGYTLDEIDEIISSYFNDI